MRVLILFALGLAAVAQADPAPGVIQQCASCHGPDGVSRWGEVPNISGLPEIVIANALYDFRGHARPCRVPACGEEGTCPKMTMCQIAGPLSDGEMDVIARYYSAQPFSPSVAEYDEVKAAQGAQIHDKYCETCHSAGGTDPEDEASILRGQNTEYIRNAMSDYRSGKRLGEDAMLRKFNKLTPEEVDALAHFYASPTD
jgi:sulfide dehydrogenase cytochrome subunit